jgi:hypothetical protein
LVLVGSSTGGALCAFIAARAETELKAKVTETVPARARRIVLHIPWTMTILPFSLARGKVACLVGISAAFRVRIPAYPVISTLFAW